MCQWYSYKINKTKRIRTKYYHVLPSYQNPRFIFYSTFIHLHSLIILNEFLMLCIMQCRQLVGDVESPLVWEEGVTPVVGRIEPPLRCKSTSTPRGPLSSSGVNTYIVMYLPMWWGLQISTWLFAIHVPICTLWVHRSMVCTINYLFPNTDFSHFWPWLTRNLL